MLENPFLSTPQVESPASRSWAAGLLFGLQGPKQSSFNQADVPSEEADAFNQGVLASQDAAINGLEFEQTCVDLNVEPASLLHFTIDASIEWSLRELRCMRFTATKCDEVALVFRDMDFGVSAAKTFVLPGSAVVVHWWDRSMGSGNHFHFKE
jgi:hypothetical protein